MLKHVVTPLHAITLTEKARCNPAAGLVDHAADRRRLRFGVFLRHDLPRSIGRRLTRRDVRKPVRNALVAIDAGLFLIGQISRMHVLGADALSREVHVVVVVTIPAFQ